MDMLFFLEVSLAGLGSGGLYALVALAFVIVCKATRVVNIAIGEFLMLGAYVFYAFAAGMEWPVWLAIVGAVVVSGALGALVERLTIGHPHRILRREGRVKSPYHAGNL